MVLARKLGAERGKSLNLREYVSHSEVEHYVREKMETMRLNGETKNKGSCIRQSINICIVNYYGKSGNGRKRKMTKEDKKNPKRWDIFYYDQAEFLTSETNLNEVRLRLVEPDDPVISYGK